MKTKWIIWYCSFLHICWGIQILFFNLEDKDWHGGVSWNMYVNILGLKFWGMSMLLTSVLAMACVFRNKADVLSVILILPQQFVVLLWFIGMIAILFGVFYDFTLSRVLRVLPLSAGLGIFHTCAILEHFGGLMFSPIRQEKLFKDEDGGAGNSHV